MTATLGGSVDARISGQVSGQIAVGNNIVQYHVEHGGVVNVAAPEERPNPGPGPCPSPPICGADGRESSSAVSASWRRPAPPSKRAYRCNFTGPRGWARPAS